ncbi:MAG TPA: carbohydrate-binding protein [Tepidisphaeraceae bacterium]|jgi:subtilisin family serine protease|nr:carbohydrate-binding protein [Tepidisphaeraceae bacterium]
MWNTKKRQLSACQRVVNFAIENLEERRLLAWGAYEQMMDLDQLVAKYPTINGKGVAIADIDSGISFYHPVFSGRIWTNPGEIAGNGIDDDLSGKIDDIHGWDFVQNDNTPTDDQGHGTYTASVLVANQWLNTGNSKGYAGDKATYQGVASGAKVIPLKVIDGNLSYSVANVEKALQWVIKNYKKYNIVAVNMSLHVGDAGNTQINDEMKTLYDAGVFVGASSGNWGAIDNDFAMPAGGAYAMSVGAQDSSTALAGITCRGTALDIVSPGEGPYPSRTGAEYWYGEPATSFSAPSVTAAAALLKQINPAFTVPQMQSILRDSGYTVYDPISKINYKALDLDNAVALGLSRAGVKPPTTSSQTPFSSTPISLPGTIEAENFDNGGETVAYHDTTSTNDGKVGRSSGVDLGTTDGGAGQYVGWTHSGEWLEYTVNIPTTGTYDLSARVASYSQGGSFHIEIDGANKSGTFTVPATGGWNTWTTLTKKGISLPSGQHVLRVAMDSQGANSVIGNLNWIKFTSSSTTTTSTSLKVQAESATALGGITRTLSNLSYVDAGDWAQYKGLNLGSGVTRFTVNIAVSDVNAGRQIQIRQGSTTGKILGTLTVASTGGYGVFKEQSIAITGISGIQDIYLTFSGGYGVGNIDYFRFY